MVFTRHLRLALVGTTLLLSLAGLAKADSAFGFTDCVESCIYTSGQCQTAECMCKEARNEILLDSVVACLFFNCKSDLRDYEDAFLDPMEDLCEDIHRSIPNSKIKSAEKLAESYISKLPAATTTAKSSTAVATPTPKTTAAPEPTTSSTEESTPSETSTADDADQTDEVESISTTTEDITSATGVAVPSSTAAETSAAAAEESGTPESGSGNTNPFDTPGSAAWRTQASLSLLSLPLALALFA